MIKVMSLSLLLVTPLALASTRSTIETVEVVTPVASTASTVTITPPLVTETVTVTATRGKAVQVETTTTIPAPRMWERPIPAYYGGDTGCTLDEASVVARSLWSKGATDDTVTWMLGMISRESTCDPSAHNNNRRTGDDSWGLCQINVLAGWFSPDGLLADVDRYRFAADFAHNVDACVRLWQECGRGPWNYGDYYCRPPEELQ